ncbi:NAD-dependent epimerase/dehydratase family protein [Streptomyces sp. NBC_01275]|uniref:NAD-dependent epimerase/dehydratase family protein n=1 Tax=Streptomyces sp. NBC_01275 TaxID=2903807 RepID=UPI00225110B0|nr:NAD-dependent epimerase/dehydratase family protein [Streptomyces sp. NBC_01275]MCX4760477.1 NAD-dependent epimerase/dehydratase family protein [Streptomyces sp. NBC_01275]
MDDTAVGDGDSGGGNSGGGNSGGGGGGNSGGGGDGGLGPVVLTGATGFIGSHTLRALRDRNGRGGADRAVRVRALVRRIPEGAGSGPVEWVRGDLADPAAVRGLCEGARAVVHLASYIGAEERLGEAVNVDGARALMAEATRAGVRRVVHLSTAAVYGAGPHRGVEVDEMPAEPVSVVSRTRLAGEAYARRAGAVVLRPGIVLGAGDRWVVPALRELVERVPAEWDGGRALLTVMDVGDLARLIAAVAVGPRRVPPGVYHAGHPDPVRIGDLLAELAAHGVLPPRPDADWPLPVCLERLRATPGRASERQFSLAAQDHWYLADELWKRTGLSPGPGPLSRLAGTAGWYRDRLDR